MYPMRHYIHPLLAYYMCNQWNEIFFEQIFLPCYRYKECVKRHILMMVKPTGKLTPVYITAKRKQSNMSTYSIKFDFD